MSFLNAMGRVSRQGQWRLRRVLRAQFPDGSLDLTDDGLIDLSTASDVVLTVTPRLPYRHDRWLGCCQTVSPIALSASLLTGTLFISNPGIVEALFPSGWSANVPPGLYDVRIQATVGPETAIIFDEPVELC